MRASVQEVAVAGRRERKKSELDARMAATARNLFLHGDFFVWPQLAHTLTSKLHALFEARILSGNATHQESDRWQAKRR